MSERDERLAEIRIDLETEEAGGYEAFGPEAARNLRFLLDRLAAVEQSWREAAEDVAAAIRERDAARREAEMLKAALERYYRRDNPEGAWCSCYGCARPLLARPTAALSEEEQP